MANIVNFYTFQHWNNHTITAAVGCTSVRGAATLNVPHPSPRQGGTMLPGKMILIAGLVILAITTGCGKKKRDKDKEFATETKPATPQVATQDIFDEFYKEDSATTTPAPAPRQQPVVRSGGLPSFSENGRYAVQVSTLPSRSMADALAAKLEARGYPSYVAEVQNPTPSLSGTYYRVRIGGFDGVSAARSFGEGTLSTDGYEYWVDYRSNDNVGLEGYGMGTGSGADYSTGSTSSSYSSDPSYSSPPPIPNAPDPEPEPVAAPASPPPEPAATAPATQPAQPAAQPSSTTSEWGNDDW